MNPLWHCLDCGAALLSREDKCDLCKSTLEEQAVLDLDAFLFRDNYADRDDDEYRRTARRTRNRAERERMREWRDHLMRQSRL